MPGTKLGAGLKGFRFGDSDCDCEISSWVSSRRDSGPASPPKLKNWLPGKLEFFFGTEFDAELVFRLSSSSRFVFIFLMRTGTSSLVESLLRFL